MSIELPNQLEKELKNYDLVLNLLTEKNPEKFPELENLLRRNSLIRSFVFSNPVQRNMYETIEIEYRKLNPVVLSTQDNQVFQNPNIEGYIQLPSGIYLEKEKILPNNDWDKTHLGLNNISHLNETFVMPRAKNLWELIFYCRDNLQDLELKKIYDEMTKNEGNWRGEWANELFVRNNLGKRFQQLDIAHVTGVDSGNKLEFSKEPLEECVWEDCYVDISSSEYINSQGMPTKKADNQKYIPGQTIYFYYPRESSVARFSMYSDRAYFSGGRDRSGSYSSLRVRPVLKVK